MGFGIKELVVILVIVILLFGTKKLKNLGSDLGSAIRGFRKSVSDDNSEAEGDEPEQLQQSASESEPDAAKPASKEEAKH